MALLGARTLTMQRRSSSAWTAGRWVRGSPVAQGFRGSVQRLSGRDWQGLPSGDRFKDARKVITQQQGLLRTDDQHAGVEADEVLIDGTTYKVVHVDTSHPLIRHDMVFVVREQEQPAAQAAGTLTAIEDAIRSWLVAFGADGGIPNADSAVIFDSANGPRPALPYVTISVEMLDDRIGYDETRINLDVSEPRGVRQGLASLQSFGPGAESWLERATFMLTSEAALAELTGLWLEPEGGLIDVSSLIDTDQETRYRRDFLFRYTRTAELTEQTTGTELDTVVHNDDIGGRIQSVTIDLT